MNMQAWTRPETSLDWFLLCSFGIFNLTLFAALAYFGVRLLMGDEAAIRRTGFIFAAEILSFLTSMLVFWSGPVRGVNMVIQGITESPLAPQFVTGYPLIGLVVTVLLARVSRRMPTRDQADSLTR